MMRINLSSFKLRFGRLARNLGRSFQSEPPAKPWGPIHHWAWDSNPRFYRWLLQEPARVNPPRQRSNRE